MKPEEILSSHKGNLNQKTLTQEGSLLSLENDGILTPSLQKTLEMPTPEAKDGEESYMNYSLSDDEMEQKLKNTIAGLISTVKKGVDKDIEVDQGLDLTKISRVEGGMKDNVTLDIEDSHDQESAFE